MGIKKSGDISKSLQNRGVAIIKSTISAVENSTFFLRDKIDESLANGKIRQGTGRLRGALKYDFDIQSTKIVGKVFMDGSVPYASIQERGGQTRAHEIMMKDKVLYFYWKRFDNYFSFGKVNHPGGTIEGKGYFYNTVEENLSQIDKIMRKNNENE